MKQGWEIKKLGEICEKIGRGISPKYIENNGIIVLNQKCIRDHKINFDLARRHEEKNKNVSIDKFIRIGDVLVNSTGEGTLGRVAQVRNLPMEKVTIDSHVSIVRPLKDIFYIDFFGWAMVFIEGEIKKSGAGASGQIELARTVLENNFSINYPKSISEQQRIVSILDEAFAAIAKAKANAEQNLKNAKELFESYLQWVFENKGDGWEEKTLKEISIEFARGKSKHRPRGDESLLGGEYPLIQTGDISNAEHWIYEFSQTYNEKGLAQSKLWPKRTICIAIVGANVGETAILNFDACFPDSVIGIVVNPKKANCEYVDYLLQTFKAYLKEKGKGTARDNKFRNI